MAVYPTSLHSAENVLRDVHDRELQALRTTATATIVVPGGLEVNIDHTEDSVQLGNGTNLFTSTTESGKVGLDVAIINELSLPTVESLLTQIANNVLTNPQIINLSLTNSGTEYAYAFPAGTKKFTMRSRNSGRIQFSFAVGQSNTVYMTLPIGSSYTEEKLDTNFSIYVQSNKNNDIAEIVYWT
jgi:hypothetical protein